MLLMQLLNPKLSIHFSLFRFELPDATKFAFEHSWRPLKRAFQKTTSSLGQMLFCSEEIARIAPPF